jgi:tetratricopeptide (TPR) repeat protein
VIIAIFAASSLTFAATEMMSSAAAAGSPPADVVIDLAVEPRGELELTAPQAQPFTVQIANLAPSATYRVNVEWSVAAGNPRPPDRASIQTHEFPRAGWQRPGRLDFGPPCSTLQDEAHALLDSVAEADAAARLGALERETLPDQCRTLIRLLMDGARPRLPISYSLHDRDRLVVTVDRLEAASRRVVRTWRAVIRPAAAGTARWAWANEEEWAVGEVALDLAEMLRFAREGSIPEPTLILTGIAEDPSAPVRAYRVTMDAGRGATFTHTIAVGRHLWAPDAYEGLARSLLQRTGLRSARARGETHVPNALLEPTAATLRREARRVSERLRSAMADGEAHADAALVLGALALRESDGEFADYRSTLCRITAHLALSLALRRPGPGSPREQMAQALLATLVGRQREALDRLEVIEAADASATSRAWVRALRLRNTHDWRLLGHPEEGSLLERLAYFRVVRAATGSARAEELLSRSPAGSLPDWGWLVLGGGFLSVGEGSRFAELHTTRRELAEAWAEFAVAGDPAEAQLDVPAERCIVRSGRQGAARIEVVGWGRWAQFYQRQLCLVMVRAEDHLGRMLGTEEGASRFRREAQASLGHLGPFPVVQTRWILRFAESAASRQYHVLSEPAPAADDLDDERACKAFADRLQRTPEAVTFANWILMRSMCAVARDRGLLPPPHEWFSTGLPTGTTYDVGARFDGWDQIGQPNPDAEALRRIAPFSLPVLGYSARRRHSDSPGAAELEAALRPLTTYDLRAMRWVADRSYHDPAVHSRWLRAIAEVNPQVYVGLGRYLAQRDMDEEAAAAFEKGIALAPDRVSVAHSLDWLVDFYFDRGQTQDALRVARYGAGVSSGAGLLTMARLMERLGDDESAEDWYERTVEGYRVRTHLLRFYLRHDQRHPGGRFASEARDAEREIFPGGLERFAQGTIEGEPPSGQAYVVSPLDVDERDRRFGLRAGDRIVAVDGFRVRDERQFLTVRSFRDEPSMTVVAWRDGALVRIEGYYRRYRYGPARPR